MAEAPWTNQDRADFHSYMMLMHAWGQLVVTRRPPSFTALIDIRDAVAVMEGRACCIWEHEPDCPRCDMEELRDYVPPL